MKINPIASFENLGGKVYQLSILEKIARVPPFFVVKFDTQDEIENDLIQSEILKQFDLLNTSIVAVRSSATIEDSSNASFAGMFKSELNITKNNLICAIKTVYNSLNSAQTSDYCEIRDLNNNRGEMRVIVQAMVNSRVSGVCITRMPEDDNKLGIGCCLGLGEFYVSGKADSDNYLVDRKTLEIVSVRVGQQRRMLDFNTKSEIPVPFYLRNSKKLTNSEIIELAKMCLQVEESMKYPSADIEWAYEGERLILLQVRHCVRT